MVWFRIGTWQSFHCGSYSVKCLNLSLSETNSFFVLLCCKQVSNWLSMRREKTVWFERTAVWDVVWDVVRDWASKIFRTLLAELPYVWHWFSRIDFFPTKSALEVQNNNFEQQFCLMWRYQRLRQLVLR